MLPPARRGPARRRRTDALIAAANDTGEALFTRTVLDGRVALRFSIGGRTTEERHVRAGWDLPPTPRRLSAVGLRRSAASSGRSRHCRRRAACDERAASRRWCGRRGRGTAPTRAVGTVAGEAVPRVDVGHGVGRVRSVEAQLDVRQMMARRRDVRSRS